MIRFLKSYPRFFFSGADKKRILDAIRTLEKESSAELRVHVQRLAKEKDIISHSQRVFEHLGMTKTKERNGVLIFICPKSRRFAVIGDSGIHEKLPAGYWDEAAQMMEQHFRRNDFAEGVIQAIQKIGEKLKTFFPRKPDDRNELSDQISF